MKELILVSTKLKEADFFLEKMISANKHIDELDYYFSAYCSAARSVTFVLQYIGRDITGFDEWYTQIQTKMKNNIICKYLLEARNESQKKGICPIARGIEFELSSGEKQLLHYFSYYRDDQPAKIPSDDVITTCKDQMKILVEIVSDFFAKFEDLAWNQENAKANIITHFRDSVEKGQIPAFVIAPTETFLTSPDFHPPKPSDAIHNLKDKYHAQGHETS